MSKLSSLLLVLVGVLYPFIVYFGTGHLSAPVLGLLIAALWLMRAPALMRQPGGRWMLGATLVYCVVLAVGGSEHLVRWYPSLLCGLLLVVFGVTLVAGPPIIERIARLTDPDFPPEAVAYTRKVTWMWAGFFAINGTLSAALAAVGPLSWWTFYNGVVAYVAMGTLFAGEWLVRQRLRRRIRNQPMKRAATRLATHPWVQAAAGGDAGAQGPGMVVSLTALGHTALLRHGRVGLVNELGSQAAGDDVLSTPLVWRFVETLPRIGEINTLLCAPLPDQITLLDESRDADTCIIDFVLPLDLACFAEHFPRAPVVPGVLQIDWALHMAAARFGTPAICRAIDQMKFQRLLRPGDRVRLTLRHDRARGAVHFAYRVGDIAVSSAHLQVSEVTDHAR